MLPSALQLQCGRVKEQQKKGTRPCRNELCLNGAATVTCRGVVAAQAAQAANLGQKLKLNPRSSCERARPHTNGIWCFSRDCRNWFWDVPHAKEGQVRRERGEKPEGRA